MQNKKYKQIPFRKYRAFLIFFPEGEDQCFLRAQRPRRGPYDSFPAALEFPVLLTRPQSREISPFPAVPSSPAGINIRTFALQAPGLLVPKPAGAGQWT